MSSTEGGILFLMYLQGARIDRFTPDKPGRFPFPARFSALVIQCKITRRLSQG